LAEPIEGEPKVVGASIGEWLAEVFWQATKNEAAEKERNQLKSVCPRTSVSSLPLFGTITKAFSLICSTFSQHYR